MAGWRKSRNGLRHDLLSSPDVNWVIRLGKLDVQGRWHMWGRRQVYTEFWWGNLKGKRPLWRPVHRWEDNIEMGVKEIG
jgi:hypothetical protein